MIQTPISTRETTIFWQKMLNKAVALSSMILLLLFQGACGAPTKSADEVRSDLFLSTSLQDRLDVICSNLAKEEALAKAGSPLPDCADAGDYAINYATSSAFYIKGFDAVTSDKSQGVDTIKLRTQIWFDQTMLRIIGQVLENIRSTQESNQTAETAGIKLPEGDAQEIVVATDLLKLSAKLLGKPKVELNPMRLFQAADLKVSGLVPLALSVDLLVTIRDNGFVVVLNGRESSPDSLIKDMTVTGFLLPYANQTYIDMQVHLSMRSGGWGPVGAKAIKALIDESLKGTLDEFLGFEAVPK